MTIRIIARHIKPSNLGTKLAYAYFEDNPEYRIAVLFNDANEVGGMYSMPNAPFASMTTIIALMNEIHRELPNIVFEECLE
jgi:hypothetical protein